MGVRKVGMAGWRRLGVAAALVAAMGAAHADGGVKEQAREQAKGAILADGLSTAAGLAAGAAEMNPLGPVLSIGVKFAVMEYAKTLPDTEQPAVYAMAASLWSGAAANNVCVTAALLTGGSFAPACIALGVAWGMKAWQESAREREFWEGCALLREYAKDPALACVYTPGENPVAGKAPQVVVTLLDADEMEAEGH